MLRPRPSAPGTSSPLSSSAGATTTAMDNPRAHLLERKHHDPPSPPSYNTIDGSSSSPESPIPPAEDGEMDLSNMSRKSQWIILAVASGACAAFNGVFAKLYVKVYSFFLRHVCNHQQIVMNCSSQLLPHCFLRSLMRYSHSRIFRVLSLLTSLSNLVWAHRWSLKANMGYAGQQQSSQQASRLQLLSFWAWGAGRGLWRLL
jgi:hypothetical protein